MVTRAGTEFVIVGPKGEYRAAPQGRTLTLAHVDVTGVGITDYEPLFTEIWALCPPGVVDTLEFAWRAGDPYETDVVRKR